MSSTRDKNSISNYLLEKSYREKQIDNILFESYVKPKTTMIAGNGLIHGRVAHSELSKNFTDVENYLFGIRANDLENPNKEKPTLVIRNLSNLDIIEKPTIYLHSYNDVLTGQRLRLMKNADGSDNPLPSRWQYFPQPWEASHQKN